MCFLAILNAIVRSRKFIPPAQETEQHFLYHFFVILRTLILTIILIPIY